MRPNTSALTIKLAKLYPSVSRTLLHHYLGTVRHPDSIPEQYRPLCEAYRKDWTAEYLLAEITRYPGMLCDFDRLYHVVFIGVTRGQLLANKTQQVTLSFRKAKAEFQLPAYVIVTLKGN